MFVAKKRVARRVISRGDGFLVLKWGGAVVIGGYSRVL